MHIILYIINNVINIIIIHPFIYLHKIKWKKLKLIAIYLTSIVVLVKLIEAIFECYLMKLTFNKTECFCIKVLKDKQNVNLILTQIDLCHFSIFYNLLLVI